MTKYDNNMTCPAMPKKYLFSTEVGIVQVCQKGMKLAIYYWQRCYDDPSMLYSDIDDPRMLSSSGPSWSLLY